VKNRGKSKKNPTEMNLPDYAKNVESVSEKKEKPIICRFTRRAALVPPTYNF
jgi:hypothetical protein